MQNHSQRKLDKQPRSFRLWLCSNIRSRLKQFQQREKATTLPAKNLELPVAEVADQSLLPTVKKLSEKKKSCDVCNCLDPKGHVDTRNVSINGNQIPTLRLGPGFPAKDCGYCDLLFRVVMEFYPFTNDSKYERTWKSPALAILLAEHHPISLWVPVSYNNIQHCGWVDIYALSDVPIIPSIGKAISIPESSDSQSCFDFIQKCLSDCREHVGCQESYSSGLPRRLLHLEGPSNSFELQIHQRPKIRLCETNGQLHRYAALSHCWGSTQIIATKRENIRKFKDIIQWCLLPQTFQDAINAALRLKIHYLWIDSLCIIQDDKNDWDTEAARMGAIYENSCLTIAATSSQSGAVPFLVKRSPKYRPKTLQFPNPQRLSNTINNQTVFGSSDDIKALRVRQGQSTHSISLSGLFKPRIYGPLTTRGWALQERVLSGRIIHFTEEGIVWECRTSIQSEDQRRLFPGHLQKWGNLSNIKDKETQRSELQAFWRELLIEYTKRRLTKREDVLPALSGIAARMQSFHNSRYFAGLWYDRFIEDLCWRPLGKGGEYQLFVPSPSDLVPDEDLDLPSWSWISIRRSISFAVIDEPGTFARYSKILNCGCIPADSNPFGKVWSGCAVVEGPLFEASISYNGVQATFTDPRISEILIELQAPLLGHNPALMSSGRLVNTVRRGRKGEEIKSLNCTVWCLYLGHWKPEKWLLTIGGLDHDFLMILGLSDRVAGAYERIGNAYSLFGNSAVKLVENAPVQQVSIV